MHRYPLTPLAVHLFSILGYLFILPAQAEQLAILPDKNAPIAQRPTVLATANGIPQINIQTPNKKGLSHNQYHQFDVDRKGVILNNARKNSQTQLAGWVQANPNLLGGEAKIILNEVNSQRPSELKGYIEVAGKRAEVIIANPNGLHCNSCGTINASRTTLTTGKPYLNQDKITHYRVNQGNITISGKGLDSSQSDYTDIIAHNVKIDAGIWAKELTVITGNNSVNANITAQNGVVYLGQSISDKSPHFSVDVSQLGGMYAGHIHLIDKGNGLGVRNAGHIGAAAGEVKITTEGQLVNTGYLDAKQDITLQSQQQIENQTTGVIYSQQGHLQATSKQKGIQQQGSLIAKGKAQGKGNITLKAKETISQSGESLAEGNITYQA
ncbi:filamentous hemagglutinin N-terminal domain-containing protein, partial [Gallibacterium genomosp. 3]